MTRKILAVFAGPSFDSLIGGDHRGCGPIEEFSNLSGSEAEASALFLIHFLPSSLVSGSGADILVQDPMPVQPSTVLAHTA
jgi:hypothetical protein